MTQNSAASPIPDDEPDQSPIMGLNISLLTPAQIAALARVSSHQRNQGAKGGRPRKEEPPILQSTLDRRRLMGKTIEDSPIDPARPECGSILPRWRLMGIITEEQLRSGEAHGRIVCRFTARLRMLTGQGLSQTATGMRFPYKSTCEPEEIMDQITRLQAAGEHDYGWPVSDIAELNARYAALKANPKINPHAVHYLHRACVTDDIDDWLVRPWPRVAINGVIRCLAVLEQFVD